MAKGCPGGKKRSGGKGVLIFPQPTMTPVIISEIMITKIGDRIIWAMIFGDLIIKHLV